MSTNYSPAIVTDGAVFVGDALMPSTATSATTLYDRAGSYDGTMYNGTCLNFDGTDERVFTSGYFGALAGDDDVTLCAWINVDVNGGYLEARCYNGGSVLTNTDAHAISTGTWYHVAGVFSGGNVTLYKDGVAAAAVACSNQSIAEASTGFQLGRGWTSVSIWMNGQISNPMAFNTTLSASQIKEIYQDSKVIIPSNVSQTNLKGFWTFAEGAGDICYDGSGRGIDGTFDNMEAADWLTGQTGCPQLVEGYNRPMLFDGSSEYVTLSSASVAGASAGTVSTWIYMTGAAVDHATIYTCQVGANWVDMRLTLNISSPNKIRFHLANGTTSITNYLISSALNYNQWYHVAGTYDGTTAKIYIDGSLDATYSTTVTPGSFTPGFTGIGWMASGARYFPGIINEVAVYDSALTLAQVGVLAATGPNGGPLPPNPSTTNLIGYWRNDGNVTWTDRSGNGNNGTVTGSPDALLFKQGF